MRILAVVYCLPPLLVPAAMCYLKLILGLRENGVEVEALAIDPDTFVGPVGGLEDPTLARLLPQDLVVHRVRSPESHPIVRLLKRSDPVYRALYRVFEPRKREWTLAARKTLGRLDLRQYDAVLTCSQPHANHLLGLEIKKGIRRPWVAYFSDPWSRNPYVSRISSRITAYHRQLESQVLAEADLVLFTSPEMERLALGEFPSLLSGKTGVVPHGFVPSWYELARAAAPPPGPLRILHTGHFYGPRSPLPLLQALQGLNSRGDLASRLFFSFYGSFPASDRDLVRNGGLEPFFDIHGVVPYLESLALMHQHDALLLIDAPLRDQSESVFLPSKLVDYVGSGKPVIALTPREGATSRVLSEVGGHVREITDTPSIEKLFADLAGGMPLLAPDPERTEEYHYVRVASKLLSHLEKL
jgi:Glycosyl transferase 4-like domain